MIFLKEGVQLISSSGLLLHPVWDDYALKRIEDTFSQFSSPTTITSGWDGAHRTDSLHYKGRGLDFRTRDVKKFLRVHLTAAVVNILGAEFDVIFEGDHLHIEFDPK